jgi:hypothetical protein
MNILQVQDRLKGLSEQQLATEMQSPSGMAPQFLVLTELQRRKRVRDDFQAQSAKSATTVAQDAVAAAGVPQEGLAPMARAMAPKTDMTQNTGIMSVAPQATATPEEPQQMAHGGMVRKMREGRTVVRGGRTYTEDENGVLRDARGNVIQSVGQDLANFYEGITTLPSRSGEMLGEYSADLADQMNERLTAQDRANLGERVQGQRVMPATTGYTYPDVPVEDMGGMAMLANALDGRAGPMTSGRDFSLLGAPELQNPALRTPAAGGAGLATALEEASKNPPTEYEQRVARTRRDIADMAADRRTIEDERTRRILETIDAGNPITDLEDIVVSETPIERARRVIAEDRARRAKSVVPQYTEDTVFDPMTGVPISGGGVVGEVPDPNSTGNWWEDFTMTDEAQRQLNETRAKVEAAKAAASGPTVTAQPADADTPRPKARPTGAVEDLTAPPAPPGGGGGAGSGGVGAAGPQTDYEKAIADALTRVDKRAEQDKWMALAQAGLALMSSSSPTLAGALGEAGAAGLGAFQSSRDEAEKTRLGLLGTQYEMDMAKQKMAMARAQAGARASSGGIGGLKLKDMLGQMKSVAEIANNQLALVTGGMDPQAAIAAAQEDGNLERASEIKSAYDEALRAHSDYIGAVRYISGAGGADAGDPDEGTIDAADE